MLAASTVPGTEWIVASDAQRMWRVFHEHYELCVLPAEDNVRDGGAHYRYRRWNVPCRPGAVYLLEPDTLHANDRLYGPSSYYVVKIKPSLIAELSLELGLGDRPHLRIPVVNDRRILGALRDLCSSIAADGLETETRLALAVRTVLDHCAEDRLRDPRDGSPRALARARDYLHANVRGRVSLADLCDVSGLGRYQLVRAFRRSYGLPPHAYQVQMRVADARRQLAAGTPPSAVDAGFFDQAHLTRHFKRAYAVTPAAYQHAILS